MASDNIDRAEQLRLRTREFGIRILHAFRSLDRSPESRILGGQMLRAGTSVPANYRASCRARSRREFIAKLGTVAEEADESQFWLDFFIYAGMLKRNRTEPLLKEATELTAIFSASLSTAKARQRRKIARPKENPQMDQ
jgi:four helix bundle protein